MNTITIINIGLIIGGVLGITLMCILQINRENY